jgi:hypothetical protein
MGKIARPDIQQLTKKNIAAIKAGQRDKYL